MWGFGFWGGAVMPDFSENTTFDDINPFSGKKLKKETLTLKPYLFPIYA